MGALLLTGLLCFRIVTAQGGVFGGRDDEVLALVITFYFGSRAFSR